MIRTNSEMTVETGSLVEQDILTIMDSNLRGVAKIMYIDGKLLVVSVNEQFYLLPGCSTEETLWEDGDLFHIIHDDDKLLVSLLLEAQYPKQAKIDMDYRIVDKVGRIFWHRLTGTYKGIDNGVPFYECLIQDITTYKNALLKLESQKGKDSLTGLYDKKKIRSYIETILGNTPNHPYIMGIIDFDHFEEINKNFGHMFGDMLLTNFAKYLREMVPEGSCVGRVGGDEFLVFSPCQTLCEGKEKIDLLIFELEKKISHKYSIDVFSCSLGISAYPNHGDTYNSLFKKADQALYIAKCSDVTMSEMYNDNMKEIFAHDLNIFMDSYQGEENFQDQYQKLFDRDLAVFAFDVLSNTLDSIKAIRIILARLAEQMNIHCFQIIENYTVADNQRPYRNYTNGSEYIVTFHWNDQGTFTTCDEKTSTIFPLEEAIENSKESNRIFAIENCTQDFVPPSFDTLFQKVKPKSMLGCGLYLMDELIGGICLFDTVSPRSWTEYEKRTLLIISKMFPSYIGMYRAQKIVEKKVDRLTNFDRITGLCKKDKFMKSSKEILQHYNKTNATYAIVYTDICNFKYVNDTYGYVVGDEILKNYANVVKISEQSGICCRIHSDHFVSFATLNSKSEFISIVQHINHTIEKQTEKKYPQSKISFSTGIFFFENSTQDIQEAMDNANIARKEAKKIPKSNLKIFDEKLSKERKRECEIEAIMHKALENKEFKVFIQPKYNIKNGQIIGGEALVRWIRPDGNMYYPDEFIPLFERNGFIEELDFYILERVCSTLREFHINEIPSIPISVNQSRYLLTNPEYIHRVKNIIQKYRVQPHMIELELTETMILNSINNVVDILNQLKSINVNLSIDDFGSGYSSLTLLKSLPVDVIKIDRAFLDESSQSKPARIIIESVVGLARRLGIQTICEGIETIEQADFLRSISCHYVQGYLYARPMPLNEYKQVLLAASESKMH